MPISRTALTDYLTSLYGPETDAYHDPGANGLQVPGAETVERVVTGVTASVELLDAAAREGASAVVVHHGLYVAGPYLRGAMDARLRRLYRHDINLYGYHFLMDVHPEIGNNAVLLRRLGAELGAPFGAIGGASWGFEGTFHSPLTRDDFAALLGSYSGGTLRASYAYGTHTIRRIGVVTGAGTSALAEASAKGLDALVVGEVRESTQEDVRDSSMNLFALGHYRSERFGPMALAERIPRELGIPASFIDVPNET